MLPAISSGYIWTHKLVLDNANSVFNSTSHYQDFLVFGMPANHMIVTCKVAVLVNFTMSPGTAATIYIGNSNVFPVPPALVIPNYVTNLGNCYGTGNLMIPVTANPNYEYGSFEWFTLSAPGTNSSVSQAYCLPQRFDAHDVIARVVTTGGLINNITAGAVEITVQYTLC